MKSTILKSIRKPLVITLSILILMALTAFTAYRITMDNISVSISEDTARLTVYGQSDDYDYNEVNMNPTLTINK